jgi:hypothetical protein
LCWCLVGLETEGKLVHISLSPNKTTCGGFTVWAIPSVHGGEAFENSTIFLYGCELAAVVVAKLPNGVADPPLALTFKMLLINLCFWTNILVPCYERPWSVQFEVKFQIICCCHLVILYWLGYLNLNCIPCSCVPDNMLRCLLVPYWHLKVWFGTRVFVGINGDNPHQIPNPHSLLKIYLVLEYWASLIPANPTFLQILAYFSQSPKLYLYLVNCGWGFVEIGWR